MQICPKCQQQNRDQARFCQHCGTALAARRVCPRCNTENPPNARYCFNCAAPLNSSSTPDLHTGAILQNTLLGGRYSVVRKLGQGGMGAVYLVSDTRLSGKLWAVKEMSDAALTDPLEKQSAVQAFKNEAALLASLEHPNLAKVVDFFADLGKHFLVMDYIEGHTLAELLQGRQQPFSEAEVLPWAEQLCQVLHYLHSQPQPIIFRDLKPGNIMLDRTGKVRLIDFGIARLFKPGKERDTMSYGTTGYAPPEQFGKGQTDARSDIYSMGATLHHLLTLRDPADQPFRFPPVRTLNPSVSPHVDEAIMKAVEQEPEKRWQHVEDFAQALCASFVPTKSPFSPQGVESLAPTMVTPSSLLESAPLPLSEPMSKPEKARQTPKPLKRAAFLPTMIVFLFATVLISLGISYYNYYLGRPVAEIENLPYLIWIGTLFSPFILLAPVITKRPGMAFIPTALSFIIGGVASLTFIFYAFSSELLFAIMEYKKYNKNVYFLSLLLGYIGETLLIFFTDYIYFDFWQHLTSILVFALASGVIETIDRFIFRR